MNPTVVFDKAFWKILRDEEFAEALGSEVTSIESKKTETFRKKAQNCWWIRNTAQGLQAIHMIL